MSGISGHVQANSGHNILFVDERREAVSQGVTSQLPGIFSSVRTATGLPGSSGHALPYAYVGTAPLCLGPSSVYPKRAVPHAGTPATPANAVALFAAPDGPRVRIRRLQFLLLQFSRVVCIKMCPAVAAADGYASMKRCCMSITSIRVNIFIYGRVPAGRYRQYPPAHVHTGGAWRPESRIQTFHLSRVQ